MWKTFIVGVLNNENDVTFKQGIRVCLNLKFNLLQ